MKRWAISLLAFTLVAGCRQPAPQSTAAGGPAAGAAAAASTPRAAGMAAPTTTTPAAAAPGSTQTATGAPAAARKVVYVDVRTPAEYATQHVEGAINIPVQAMQSRYRELEKYRDRTIILYCHSGHRAGMALQILQSVGFTNARNGGSLSGLLAQGVPAGS